MEDSNSLWEAVEWKCNDNPTSTVVKKEKGDKKVSDAPVAPTRTRKIGEPINDYIVDFEGAYSNAAASFEVKPTVRHDYKACGGIAGILEKSSRRILSVHEDRLRQFGNDFHHDLELLALNVTKNDHIEIVQLGQGRRHAQPRLQ